MCEGDKREEAEDGLRNDALFLFLLLFRIVINSCGSIAAD